MERHIVGMLEVREFDAWRGVVTRRDILGGATVSVASPASVREQQPLRGVPGPPDIMGTSTAVSPDGRWIAFEVYRAVYPPGTQVWWSAIGLLDTTTGAVRRIPTPEGRSHSRPIFHPDGTHVFCRWGRAGGWMRGVCSIDLATGEQRDLYGLDSPLPDPPIDYLSGFGVARDGKSLLVSRCDSVIRQSLHDLRLVELERNTVRAGLPAHEGAGYFGDIHFLNDTNVLLTAGVGFGTTVAAEVAALGLTSVNSLLLRLRFGGLPSILVPELERHPNSPNDNGGLRRIGLARDGTLVATAQRRRPGPGFSNQIAEVDVDRQQLRYITTVPGIKDGVSIAADGSRVAFMSNETMSRSRISDLWSLDRRRGSVVRHNLLPRLQADPQFSLP